MSLIELKEELERDRAVAQQSYEILKTSLPVKDEQAQVISDDSYGFRTRWASTLELQWQTYPSPFDFVTAVPELLDPTTAYLVPYLREENVSPFPTQFDVTQDPYWTDVTPEEWRFADKEAKWEIVIDICLDTLGLLEIQEIVREVLAQMDGYAEQQASLRAALEKSSSEQKRDALFAFMEWLLLRKQVEAIIAGLAERRVAAIFLRSLCLKMVPFVGWAWLLVSFGLAINRHWGRLMAS